MQEFEVKAPSLVQKTRLLSNSVCCVLARQTNCHDRYSRPRHLPIWCVAEGVYGGYLMTQEGEDAGSQLICVNADAQGVDKSNTTGFQGLFLQPVAYKCLGASCTEIHNKPMALPCLMLYVRSKADNSGINI